MCGRYVLSSPAEVVREVFGLDEGISFAPRYNVAPGQRVPIVRERDGGGREWLEARWGLVPFWAKEPSIGTRLINARAETAAEKPSFRHAFRKQRCLVPADGYYEWKREGRSKQPYLFRRRDGSPFAMAGLWSRWQPPDGGPELATCAILTTSPNALAAAVHDRMPAILATDRFPLWLDSGVSDPTQLLPLLGPFPEAEMVAYPVSTRVNDPRNEGPELVRSIG